MRVISSAVVCLLGILLLVGCSKEPSIVGKWNGTVSQQGQQMDMVMEYKSDGTYVGTASINGMDMTVSGNYTMGEDNKMTSTVTDMKVGGNNVPPQLQAMLDESVKKSQGQEQSQQIKFTDNDTVEVTLGDGTMVTWKRVK